MNWKLFGALTGMALGAGDDAKVSGPVVEPDLQYRALAAAGERVQRGVPPRPEGMAQRFVVVEGMDHGERRLFRLDTFTGETWRLMPMVFPDHPKQGVPLGAMVAWSRVEEVGGDLHQAWVRAMQGMWDKQQEADKRAGRPKK